ncbi:MAG TPA: GNAT family N-acetyltransferase [Spirochaetia bacterium]|nr:GNAT family N-acetyltransferase [Spirochaetia bacterium]
MRVTELAIQDYDEVRDLWSRTEGIGLSSADTKEGFGMFLERNPGLSLALRHRGRVVGTVMVGHDGRRGYLYHLVVEPEHRGNGWAKKMVARGLAGLRALNIRKCHVFIFRSNLSGKGFWKSIDWVEREDIRVFSREITAGSKTPA